MQIDDQTVIWRYFGFEKFLKLLQSKSLYFRRADLLRRDDPYELTLDRIGYASLDFCQNHLKSLGFPSNMTEVNLWDDLVIKKFYINCWHINDDESYLMWKSYAPDGIAIKTTIGKLRKCISENTNFRVEVKKVTYEDFKEISSLGIEILTKTNNGNSITNPIDGIVARKVKQFKDENELRLIIHSHDSSKEGINFDINLEDLIEAIYVNPLLKDERLDLLKSELKIKGFKEIISFSSISKNYVSNTTFSDLNVEEKSVLAEWLYNNSSYGDVAKNSLYRMQFNHDSGQILGCFPTNISYPNNAIDDVNQTIDGIPFIKISYSEWQDWMSNQNSYTVDIKLRRLMRSK